MPSCRLRVGKSGLKNVVGLCLEHSEMRCIVAGANAFLDPHCHVAGGHCEDYWERHVEVA